MTAQPRRFRLLRHRDVTDVSGTGFVADGIRWRDGTASVIWLSDRPSIAFWYRIGEGMSDAEWVHSHGGGPDTTVVWTDEESPASARVTLTRTQMAGLLAHHADVLAARWNAAASDPGTWEVAAALSLREHAGELCDETESPAVAELLDSAMADEGQSADLETTARVFAGLHQSAAADVARVTALYEQWVTAGPPPLGTSIARWWDRRLVELHDAIVPPTAEEAQQAAPAAVHACPGPDDNGISPCCSRPPFEFPGERLTRDPAAVTCTGPTITERSAS
jgi:hypothetical protein